MITLEASDHFTLFRNRKDFISFVEEQRGLFPCPEEWEDFFGFALEIDDDGNETETVEHIDADGNAYARSRWNGDKWVEDKTFDDKTNAILEVSRDYYIVTVDIHD